jgi:HEAT repeat protein
MGDPLVIALPALVLGLVLQSPPEVERFFESAVAAPARLREMLYDRQHPRNQGQAALLLILNHTAEAEEIARQGLRQTDPPDVFLALAAALRLTRDNRFHDELLAALAGSPPVCAAAADTLAVLADSEVVQRLQALASDFRTGLKVRQTALTILGRSGQKSAAPVLIEHLTAEDETLRRTAEEALVELSGHSTGMDAASWHAWWDKHKDLPAQRWLEERLAYQVLRERRLIGELERSRAQVASLHQQLYARLPAADRLGHLQGLADHEDAAVRALAVRWGAELYTLADSVGQRALTDLLLHFSRDGALEVQRLAVLALGAVRDPRAFDQARMLLKRGLPRVRAAAATALAQQALNEAPEPSAAAETALLRQVVPLLQKALDDPYLEVVVAAAEGLGTLGIPEAAPVLARLLRHPSDSVRQTVAQALERSADAKILDALLAALEDGAVTVRFSLVGAIGRAAGDGQGLPEPQRARVLARLEELLLRDADPGVRSRSATVLGRLASPGELPFLFRRVQAREDARVQEKAWAAMVEIIVRAGNVELLREWDHTLADVRQGARRVQLLAEAARRWKQQETSRTAAVGALELLVQAQLDEGKWAAALPPLRELLARPDSDADLDRRLRWLLAAGELALQEGNRAEALLAVQEAQPFLARRPAHTADFETLEKRARP